MDGWAEAREPDRPPRGLLRARSQPDAMSRPSWGRALDGRAERRRVRRKEVDGRILVVV